MMTDYKRHVRSCISTSKSARLKFQTVILRVLAFCTHSKAREQVLRILQHERVYELEIINNIVLSHIRVQRAFVSRSKGGVYHTLRGILTTRACTRLNIIKRAFACLNVQYTLVLHGYWGYWIRPIFVHPWTRAVHGSAICSRTNDYACRFTTIL